MNTMHHIHRSMPAYPTALTRCLADGAPATLTALGNTTLLEQHPTVALFCSNTCPASLILRVHDLAHDLRQQGVLVIGGFHSPVERECLTVLLRGKQPVIICPARSIERMRIPADERTPLEQGRLLLLSPFAAPQRRMTAETARRRNRFVAALADSIFVAHAEQDSKTEALCREVLAWGKPLSTLASAANTRLIDMGATTA